MSLESLFRKGENFPQNLENFSVVPEYLLRYRRLKSSPFYNKESGWMFDDKENGAWIANVWAPDKPRDWHLWTTPQLLGVLAESLDDSDAARIRYEALKKSNFFTEERVSWNSGYHDESGWMKYDLTPTNQLIGVLAEACFDIDSAKRRYNLLKRSPLYSESTDEWQSVSNYASRSNERPTVVLPLIIEGLLFDKDIAKKKYERLKESQIESKQIWLDASAGEGRVDATSLLFGLLLEAVYDRDSAREYLGLLKDTPLYDPETQLWFRWWQKEGKDKKEFVPDVCDSEDQLLGIIVEAIIS